MVRRIRSLSPDGLRLFQDERLSFEAAGEGPDLHLVVGDKGTGKTTLCHALRLALYGTTPWVSAANVSVPRHESADGPVSATVSTEVEGPDARYRVERTLTEDSIDGSGDAMVGAPRVERTDGDDWVHVEDGETAVRELAPPETESILVSDPGLQRFAQPTGWAPVVQGLLTAAAAAPAGAQPPDSPADLWDEFGTRLEAYVDAVGLGPRYRVRVDDEPFGLAVESADGATGGRAAMPTGETIQFALAMTLAAGDCVDLPQWFDAPLGRLDHEGRAAALACFERAAERRQVVLFPHQVSLAEHPDIRQRAASEHRLELLDEYRGAITSVSED